jgi:tetratricopeptide (TPR) repeat protein
MLPRRTTLLLGTLLLAFAAVGTSSQDDGRAAELAGIARDLAGRGEARQALALVQAELSSDLSPTGRATLQFTLGWLEHQLAEQDRAGRGEHLEAARGWYRAGLEALPNQRAARANLALVEGDLALERGERDAALASWRRALELQPDLPGAGERFLELLGSDARALAAEADMLERAGHPEVAREVWARAIPATPPEAQGEPILRWLLLTAEAGAFTRDSVAELPPGGSAALAELRLLARDPQRAPTPSWAASPLGAHAVASAHRSLAAERRGYGAATDALALIGRGLEEAPEAPLSGRPPVAAELAVDELDLLLDEPGLDLGGDKTDASLERVLALEPAALAASPELTHRAHATAGRGLLAAGDRAEDGPGSARWHFEQALKAASAAAPGTRFPAPETSHLLGTASERAGAVDIALHAYLDAAEGFLAVGERARAEAALRDATAIDLAIGGSPRTRAVRAELGLAPLEVGDEPASDQPAPPPPAEVAPAGRMDGVLPRLFTLDWSGPTAAGVFAPQSWYVGAAVGAASLSSSDGEIEGDLADLSHVTNVDLDEATTAWRIYGGYRFAQPFALELGYADHGKIDSTIGPEPATGVDQFLDDIARTHPATGAGPTLAVRTLLVGTDSLSLGAKVGVWRWQSDIEVTTSSSKVAIDRDGTDLFYGVDAAWRPARWGALRLDLERYGIDEEDTDVLTFGLELDLGALLGR